MSPSPAPLGLMGLFAILVFTLPGFHVRIGHGKHRRGRQGLRYGKADNLLQLALEMQAARGGLSLDDIERLFAVGRRTAMRMRDAVLRNFPQAEEVAGDGRAKRWRLPPGTLDRLAAVSADQLAALDLGVRLLHRDNREVEAALLTTLSGKLRALMNPGLARRVEPDLEALLEADGLAMRPGPRPRIWPGVVEDLRQAIKARRKVRLRYRNRQTRRANDRLVHPYGFLHGHRHYLVGWHENPKANKTALFALPGIEAVTMLPDPFEPEPGFALADFATRSFGLFQEAPFPVAWRFAPGAARDAAEFVFHPGQRFEPQADGSLIVRFTAGGALEMAWHLYCWGDRVEVLEPPHLAAMVNPHRPAWPALP